MQKFAFNFDFAKSVGRSCFVSFYCLQQTRSPVILLCSDLQITLCRKQSMKKSAVSQHLPCGSQSVCVQRDRCHLEYKELAELRRLFFSGSQLRAVHEVESMLQCMGWWSSGHEQHMQLCSIAWCWPASTQWCGLTCLWVPASLFFLLSWRRRWFHQKAGCLLKTFIFFFFLFYKLTGTLHGLSSF